MVVKNSLSENQFGFRKSRSTVDAIQAVANMATKVRRGIGKHKGYCALISIEICYALNTGHVLNAKEGSRLPAADARRLSEQQEGDIQRRQMASQRREEMTCGALQESWVRLLV